jgi:hypothetical protein
MEERSTLPTISRRFDDGTLVELLYDPKNRSTALAVRPAGDVGRVVESYDLPTGERLIPYSAQNNLIATGCVLLPSSIGQFENKGDLLAAVLEFIGRYLDVSPDFAAMAAHYVLLTWVYDDFSEIPYLRLRGAFGTGKTRGLMTLGSLCYKPFFASGASTVSPIFHILEAFAGTLILDEADFRFSDATAELTKILNNGNARGLPVLRTMTNRNRELNPQAFRVFGPKIVAMRQGFADAGLESRFITEEMSRRAPSPSVPIQIPPAFHTEARELRNRLLAWRFAASGTNRPTEARLIDGLDPRARQTALPLVSLIDDPSLSTAVCLRVGQADEQLRAEDRPSVEQAILASVLAAYDRGGTAGAPIGMITNFFNEDAVKLVGRTVSPKWMGQYLRTTLGLHPVKAHGVFALPHSVRPKVMAMAERLVSP